MMRKILILILCSLFQQSMFSQKTFSNVFDLDNNGQDNFIRDFKIFEEEIIVLGLQLCSEDSNSFIECTNLTRFNIDGKMLHSKIIDTIFSGFENPLCIVDEKLYIAGHPQTSFIGRLSNVYEFDSNFEVLSTKNFSHSIDRISHVNSIIDFNGRKFLYGRIVSNSFNKTNAFITCWDDSCGVSNMKYYEARDLDVEIHDLQPTPDGNLAFILKHKSQAGPEGWNGYEIVKINFDGEVLDTFAFDDGLGFNQPFGLTIDKAGAYYFYSDKHPITRFPPSIGRVNKLNANMDSLEWSLILPNDPVTYSRQYRIVDSYFAQNGDILVCGSVYDDENPEPGPDIHTVNNGFITRLKPNGEVRWNHIYKHPNLDYLPIEEFGTFKHSGLDKILEMEDGTILVGGTTFLSNQQYLHPDFEQGVDEKRWMWLMKTDSEGCLEGERCAEVIHLGQGLLNVPIFEIGTKWTYDFEPYWPSGNGGLISGPYELTVTDTFNRNDSLVYIIRNNRFPNREDWMYQENEQIYLWMGEQVGWQLTYDFDANDSYESTFYNPRSHGLDTAIVEVNTDPSINLLFGDRGIQPIQELTIENNGTYDDMPVTADILYHCGNLYGGISLGLGLGLADPPYIIGKLRCFEQGEFSFNFTSNLAPEDFVACDSVRYISGTEDKILSTFKIYPNPAGDYITIDNVSPQTQYTITDYLGRLMQQGTIGNGSVNIQSLTSNVYFIRLQDTAHKFWVAKFVKE